MKKLLIALILIVLAGAGGYAYLKYGKTEDKASVTQAAIQSGNIVQAVQATGTLEALRTVQVGSQVSGTVKNLYADFNSIVKKDQIIAELDPSLLQVQVDVQNANISRQEGDIAQQKVNLENDQLTLTRTQAQFDKGLVSPQQLEAAQLAVKSRQANINSLEKQLIQASAQLNQAKLNVSYCTIRSPIDGVVVNRIVDIGTTVQASMTTPQFFTIATDLTTLKLSAGVDEADIGYIRPNMQVTFTVDVYGTKQFIGLVDAVRLNAQTQNNVVTYPVWINVQNPNLELRPSMTANLKIIVDQASNVVKIPNQALRFRPTTDIYTWLGMQPPAAGRGRGANANADASGRGGAGGRGADASAQAAVPGAPAAPGTPAAGRGGNAAAAQAGAEPGQDLQALAGGANPNRRQRQPQDPAATGGGQGRQSQGGFGQGQGGFGQGQSRQPGQGRGQAGAAGQNAQAGGDAASGRGGRAGGGFGRGMNNNMTPEQMAQFQQQFGGRGGRGGSGRGNRQQQQPSNAVVGDMTPITERNANKIDELFESVPKRIQPGQVWLYDEKAADPNKKLRQVNVRLGLTDGQFSELVTAGETLTAGTMVVTGVVPPPSALPKPGQTNIFQQQRGGPGGFGGPQPGGGPGGPGGGGNRGGGGGGGRGGD